MLLNHAFNEICAILLCLFRNLEVAIQEQFFALLRAELFLQQSLILIVKHQIKLRAILQFHGHEETEQLICVDLIDKDTPSFVVEDSPELDRLFIISHDVSNKFWLLRFIQVGPKASLLDDCESVQKHELAFLRTIFFKLAI